MTVTELAASITAEGALGKFTGGRQSPSTDEIARLAYQRYEMRGRHDGYDVEDWLAAEEELSRHFR